MIKIFVAKFKENLFLKLQEKTSWGRNDLMLAIEQTLSQTLMEMIE